MAKSKGFCVSLFGAMLLIFLVSSAGPVHEGSPSSSAAETVKPLSELGEAFGVAEANAKKKKKKKKKRRARRHYTPAPTPGTPAPPSTTSPTASGNWSDPATWGGDLPQEGAKIAIPSDKSITLDVSPPALKSLQIDGSLLFEDKDLTLNADWIMVHGKLQVGTEETPFRNRATISLTGTDQSENVMGMGTKVLGVMGGTLELHGETRPGWTRLAETAEKGSSTLTLESTPDWRPGDRIVVASTDYWADQSEEVVVKSVSGSTVTLESALRYQHWGVSQTYAGQTVDERAEVGLLSRNVVIEGEETSSTSGFGGQIMVMNDGQAGLEGVELNRMGQKNVLRRYPIHFHMLGDAPESYVRNSVVHHTFNRCLVVHGTNKLAIEGNVCHDHIGHGYFLEDGAETGNVFEGNLGLRTREPEDGERLLPSDRSPATFWITNPNNVFRNNAAAGSDGVGFWYALPEHPMGLSTTSEIWPRRTPLGEFSGNVAHSNGDQGLNVDDGPRPDGTTEATWYSPRTDPTDRRSSPVVANFDGFTAYKNRNHGAWHRGDNQTVTGATFADNRAAATFAAEEVFLQDSLVVGETANKGNPKSWETKGLDGRSLPFFWAPETPIVGFEFYDGRVGAQRVTFAKFNTNSQRPSGGLGYLEPNAFSIHPQNFAEAVSFDNANPVYLSDPESGYDGDNSKVFVDKDGSVTGTAGRAVVVKNPFLLNSSCSSKAEWNAHICEADYASLWLEALDDDPSAIKPLTLTRDDGETQSLMGSESDSTVAISSVFPDQNYEAAFNGGTPSKARFVLWRGKNRWVRLSIDYPVEPKVTRYGCDLADSSDWCEGASGSLEELDSATGTSYYYDAGSQKLYLKIVSAKVEWDELEVAPAS